MSLATTAYQSEEDRFNSLFGFATTCHACGVDLTDENTHPISDERGWCVECAERQMASESEQKPACKPTTRRSLASAATAAIRAEKKAAREQERQHKHYLALARLLREGRIHRVEMVNGHAEHTFENGEHVDFYESSRYAGFAYMVVGTEHGYECDCEHFEHKFHCPHTLDASARAKARYNEAQRHNELDEAAAVAVAVMPELASELHEHVEDELAGQAYTIIEAERAAIVACAVEDIEEYEAEQKRLLPYADEPLEKMPDADSDPMAQALRAPMSAARRIERTPFGTLVPMR